MSGDFPLWYRNDAIALEQSHHFLHKLRGYCLHSRQMFHRNSLTDGSSNPFHLYDLGGNSMHNVPMSDTKSSHDPIGTHVRCSAIYQPYRANPNKKPADKDAAHWHHVHCAWQLPLSVRNPESPNGTVPDWPGYVRYWYEWNPMNSNPYVFSTRGHEVRKLSTIHHYIYASYKDSYKAAMQHPSPVYSPYRVHATKEAVHPYVPMPVIRLSLRE